MAVSTKSTLQQRLLSNEIKRLVAEEAVVKSEKSLDLLLGLLTFVAWYV